MFNLDLIEKYYSALDDKLNRLRHLGSLSLSEKILYSHCFDEISKFIKDYKIKSILVEPVQEYFEDLKKIIRILKTFNLKILL